MTLSAGNQPVIANTSPLYRDFCAKTGFIGECTITTDGRIFSKLTGKFAFPVPKDSLDVLKNAEQIKNALLSIYQKNGSKFNLRMIAYDKAVNSCQYIQYWKRFSLVHQPNYLLITYHKDTALYTVYNTLYMKQISIPDTVISGKTAQKILDFIHDEKGLNPELTGIKKQYAGTDTLHTFYKMQRIYDDMFQMQLNLFPDSTNDKFEGFSLKWKTGEDLLDASNGELLGNTAKQWKEKIKLITAANQFIRDAGLKGNCESSINMYTFRFQDIHLSADAAKDSICFRKAIDTYVPYYETLCRQLGYDVRFEYAQTSYEHDNEDTWKQYKAFYRQEFRYPLPIYSSSIFGLTASYDIIRNSLSLESFLYKQPIVYPDSVMSPQNVFDSYVFSYLNRNNQERLNSFTKSYVPIQSIPAGKVYTDARFHLYARLETAVIGDIEKEGITGMHLAWHVYDGIDLNNDRMLDPIKGLVSEIPECDMDSPPTDKEGIALMQKQQKEIERVFKPLGFTRNYRFDRLNRRINAFDCTLNLPASTDSVSMMSNCMVIGRYLLQLYGVTDHDYAFRYSNFEQYSDLRMSMQLYYKGIQVSAMPGAFIYETTAYISYNGGNPGTYTVSYADFLDVKPLPDCVLSPQTAWLIAVNDEGKHYVWTELSNLSGLQDYFQCPKREPGSEDEDYEDGRDAGYIKLKFILISHTNTNPITHEYRLVWAVEPYDGSSFIIDAETGEILRHEEWDTC